MKLSSLKPLQPPASIAALAPASATVPFLNKCHAFSENYSDNFRISKCGKTYAFSYVALSPSQTALILICEIISLDENLSEPHL